MGGSSGNDDFQVYEDLKGFLMSDRVDVRKAATEAVLQIRLDDDHRQRFIQHDDGMLFQALIRNTSYENDDNDQDSVVDAAAIPVNALHALVHFSSHGSTAHQCTELMLESNMMARLMEIVLSSSNSNNNKNNEKLRQAWGKKINYAMALMANLTRLERGAVEMVGRTLPDEAVTSAQLKQTTGGNTLPKVKATLELLLDRYLNPSHVHNWPDGSSSKNDDGFVLTVEYLEKEGYDPYQHFAAVLMNATQVEQGRKFLLQLHYTTQSEEGTTLFQQLLPQLKSANPIRRRGTAGTIRNLCLDKDSSWWLLNVVQLSKDILYPLAGPEELDVDEKQGLHPDLWLEGPDKKREPDEQTRLYLVESILLLCSSGRQARDRLRLDRTYVILKWADMVEESEKVSEIINECVQYLRRDEHGTEEGSSDAFVANAYKRIVSSGATLSSQVMGDSTVDDYDDVD